MITVTSTADAGAGTLRQAVIDAVSGDTIVFDAAVVAAGNIDLSTGQILIQKNLTIQGPGSALFSITNTTAGRVFEVSNPGPAITASISGVVLGQSSDVDGGVINNSATLNLTDVVIDFGNATNDGGGIWNGGTLTMTDCQVNVCTASNTGAGIYNISTIIATNLSVSGCNATSDGGGINNDGTITATDLDVGNSQSGGNGGGIKNGAGATFTHTGGSILNNTATGDGGGIYNSGTYTLVEVSVAVNTSGTAKSDAIYNNLETVYITRSVIRHHVQASATALWNQFGSVYVNNSTFADNTGEVAIRNVGGLEINNSTFSSNDTGVVNISPFVLRPYNSIFCGNSTIDLFMATADVISGGNNILGTSTNPMTPAAGDQIGVALADVHLGPLQNNGGPTFTRALTAGSVAIDAGNVTGAPATDQRGAGFPRVQGSTIDIGAFESNIQPTPPTPTPDPVQVLLNESKCYQCFGPISAAQQLELGLLARYLLTLDAMATTDPQSLYDSGKCYGCFGPVSEFDMMKLSLLAKIAVALDAAATTDPQSLLSQSQCFACYAPEGMAGLFELALLDKIASTA